MRKLLAVLGVCLLLVTAGCVIHHRHHPHGVPPGQAGVHAHVDGCGHVFVDGVWVVVSPKHGPKPGHRHGWKK